MLDIDHFKIVSNSITVNDNIYIILGVIILLQLVTLFTKIKLVSIFIGLIGNWVGLKVLYLITNPVLECVNLNRFIKLKKIISKEELNKTLDDLIANSIIKIDIDSTIRQELIEQSINRDDLTIMFNELVKLYIEKNNIKQDSFSIYDYLANTVNMIIENRVSILVFGGILFTLGCYYYIHNSISESYLRKSISNLNDHSSIQDQSIKTLLDSQSSTSITTNQLLDRISTLGSDMKNSVDTAVKLNNNQNKISTALENLTNNVALFNERHASDNMKMKENIETLSHTVNTESLQIYLDEFTPDMAKFLSSFIVYMMNKMKNENSSQSLSSSPPTFTGSYRLGSASESNINNDTSDFSE